MAGALSDSVKKLVEQWLTWDKNEATRQEISTLAAQGKEAELSFILSKRIAFGTAGLRGAMRAGFANMNDLTVIQASQGLSLYVEKTISDAKNKGVVVGYDGRHHSHEFALLTAATFEKLGYKVYLFRKIVPTPFVAFGVLAKKAAIGVMVTASHNPKDDNGYKVYWENGCQINSPHDKGIALTIEANLPPWGVNPAVVKTSALVSDPYDEVMTAYLKAISRWSFHSAQNAASTTKIVYTAMHGVGKEAAARAFETFKLPPFIPVMQQIEPDPDFPTVAFPNPEEGKGALKLSMETAEKNGSKLIVANDPDADRFAAAERLPSGEWKIFNGNELGILFADWSWQQFKVANPHIRPEDVVVLNTTVSSKMLSALAKKEGLFYSETLTGFKWLGNLAVDLLSLKKLPGYTFLFAFEEAIGYMVGDVCFDKDGVRAAAIFAEMANHYYLSNQTLVSHLDSLYEKYGYYASINRYFFCYEPEKLAKIFGEIRNGGKYSGKCGRFPIKSIRDLTTPGYDSTTPDKKPLLPVSSGTEMITFTFENGAVITLRGSGTEPKLKYYTDMPSKPGQTRAETEKELRELVDAAIAQFLQPQKWGLLPPKD